MVLGVVGSRSFDSYRILENSITNLIFYNNITEIVSGGAEGADRLAAIFARVNNLKLKEFVPDWSKGKSAGLERNKLIVDYADVIIAFWDKESKGTVNTIKLTKEIGKPCFVITNFK